ncbi:MAG: AbiJ-NTD4 domain-containing protein [Candidatus Helarchaeota archaeon]
MKLFSQKKGYKKIKDKIQKDSMDDDLRTSIWNALTAIYWKNVKDRFITDASNRHIQTLIYRLFNVYWKEPIDTIPRGWEYNYKKIRDYFFSCKWFEVYDFILFIANNYPIKETNEKFMDICNIIFTQELSGYRFINGEITDITSEDEIKSIREALDITDSLKPVKIHLETALKHYSDKKNPDFRNSIKESISAVESLCCIIANKPEATLGDALKVIEKKIGIHGALKSAFSSLYGYTSSAQGIRHKLLEEPNLNSEDARFMLVCCSTFVNYLKEKASKAKIKF